MTAQHTPEETAFLSWVTSNGGIVAPSVAFQQFEGMGRGMVALSDIEPDTLLFSMPRSLLLTTTTSNLSALLPPDEWTQLSGWTPLILIILYEAQLPNSLWKPYFSVLPQPGSFDTLMFWSDEELGELAGSSVLDKIGRDEAEEEWRDVVVPFVKKHQAVFGAEAAYALERFHWAGSLILSRSFHVEDDEDEEDDESDDEEEEESEKVDHVALVPLADHLNALSSASNAKLFYEPQSLNMISTTTIPRGAQVFNTYADPPNADLLRRYGHVEDNDEADLTEIGLDFVARVVGKELSEEEKEERAEWLLEIGVDDTFSLTHSDPLPTELLSSIAMFNFKPSSPELAKAMSKESPPKGKLKDAEVQKWTKVVLEERLKEFECDIEADAALLFDSSLPLRRRMAIRVRLGEKKVLLAALEAASVDPEAEGSSKEKRKRGGGGEREEKNESGKKVKRT